MLRCFGGGRHVGPRLFFLGGGEVGGGVSVFSLWLSSEFVV